MARLASSLDRSALIYQLLSGANCKAELILYYKNATDTEWKRINDLDEDRGVNWGGGGTNTKVGAFLQVPTAKKIDFTVINRKGKYCEGSGDALSGVFDLDTKIKLKGGYLLPKANTGSRITADLEDGFFFHTKISGDVVIPDIETPIDDDIHFQDLFSLYDATNYDVVNYTPTGYYVYTFDLDGDNFHKAKRLRVTANHDKGIVFYRSFSNDYAAETLWKTSATWERLGATVDGTAVFRIDQTKRSKRFFQVAIIWDGTDWGGAEELTRLQLDTTQYIEWVYENVYYIDAPDFDDPPAPAIASVKCTGRDIWKKALESDFMFSSISGATIGQMIRSVCDGIGIPYTEESIPLLTEYGVWNSNPLEKPEKAIKILEYLMEILNQSPNNNVYQKYRMFTEYVEELDDHALFVAPRASAYFAASVFPYKRYEDVGSKSKNRDKLLKRVMVMSNSGKSGDSVALATYTGSTVGDVTLDWTGYEDYKYLSLQVIVSSGTPTFTYKSSTATTLTITVSGANLTQISVFGSEWTEAPDAYGEAVGWQNQFNQIGFTHTITNPFVRTSEEAKAIADGFLEDYASPVSELKNLKWPYLHLMQEMNDPAMIWSRLLFVDDLYYVTEINHHWDRSSNPADVTTFNLSDSGLNFLDRGAIVYDRYRHPIKGDAVNYDFGFVYDMAYGVNGTEADVDTSIYTQDKA